jgi:hypothetical protein
VFTSCISNPNFPTHPLSNDLQECEIVAKTSQNSWVVGRRSDQREFYVILSNKNANLIEIQGTLKRNRATRRPKVS